MQELELPAGVTKEDVDKALEAYRKTQQLTPTGDDLVIFKEFDSGNKQLTRIYRDIYVDRKGNPHETLAIRRFYHDDDVWKPGKGATFHYEDIDEIMAGLEAMKEWCEDHSHEGD